MWIRFAKGSPIPYLKRNVELNERLYKKEKIIFYKSFTITLPYTIRRLLHCTKFETYYRQRQQYLHHRHDLRSGN